MGRPALFLAIVALTLGALAGLGPQVGRPGKADAAECSWHRHAKRTVRWIRRHGRRHRVVRVRHRWTCDPPPASPAGVLPVSTPSPIPASQPEPEEEEASPNRLGVKSVEYSFTLSRPEVEPGALTVELNNQGQDAHNLHVQLADGEGPVSEVAETQSGQHTVAHLDLPPGTYRLWCSLPTHEELGMHATLVVGPGAE